MPKQIHRMPRVLPGGNLRQERKKPSRRFGFTTLVIGMVILAYWYVFQSASFQIASVELTGTDHQSVRATVDALKGQNIFRVKSTAVEQTIRQAYPPAATASLVRGLPRTVRIAVTLRTPALKWQLGDTIYMLDAEGEAFEQGDKPEYGDLPRVTDVSKNKVEIGQRIVSPSFVAFVHELHTSIPTVFKRGHKGTEVIETTFHVDALLDGDVRLRLTTQRPLAEQLEGAQAILTAHPEAKLIDVRVPRRGYWK